MVNTVLATYPTGLPHTMSYYNDNYFAAGSNSMTAPTCENCSYTVCQCNHNYNPYAPSSTRAGAYIAPASPTFPASQYLPPPQVEDRYSVASPQGAGPFSYYNRQVPQQSHYHHGGRVVDSALVETYTLGPYAYGSNNEQEARMAEMLQVFNNNFIRADDQLPATNEDVVEPQDDFLLDGTVDPGNLSLPLVERVPCPECGRLLKDQKSVSRHMARQHSSVPIQYYNCQEFGCAYSTPKRADLGRHHRAKHSDDKPFKCPICGTGSKRQDNLNRHITTCSRNALRDLENH